ncbi:hypothetical protein CDAR_429891, partial [Caerostris darwini]
TYFGTSGKARRLQKSPSSNTLKTSLQSLLTEMRKMDGREVISKSLTGTQCSPCWWAFCDIYKLSHPLHGSHDHVDESCPPSAWFLARSVRFLAGLRTLSVVGQRSRSATIDRVSLSI